MGSGRGVLQGLRRLLVTLYFMLEMIGSLLVSSKTFLVSVADVLTLLLSTMESCSSSCLSDWKAYSFSSSLADIPLLSVIRSAAVLCAYGFCGCENGYSLYLFSTLACAVGSMVFLIAKAVRFQSSGLLVHSHALLLLLSSIFSLAHIFVAVRMRQQARRKVLFRWDEEAIIQEWQPLQKQKQKRRHSPGRNIMLLAKMLNGRQTNKKRDFDLPPSSLADTDSRFLECGSISVHYKLVESPSAGVHSAPNSPTADGYPVAQVLSGCQEIFADEPPISDERNGIVLIHGFGGGAFAWRHVMNPLARQTGCSVVAFDRPGWGLTSRPSRKEWERNGVANPYELQSQADLLFTLCAKLHLTTLVLVGHDDGGLLALLAAAKASKCAGAGSSKMAVKGVVLVGVSLSREVVPSFARVLLNTPLGKQMLRPLLRTEIGQVANRRAWHDASKLTTDILELYKAPLRVEGWEQALAEVSRCASGILQSSSVAEVLETVSNLPALLVAGLQDVLVPLKAAESLATRLPHSKLVTIPGCGHLPPEECPGALLALMLPFISDLLNEA